MDCDPLYLHQLIQSTRALLRSVGTPILGCVLVSIPPSSTSPLFALASLTLTLFLLWLCLSPLPLSHLEVVILSRQDFSISQIVHLLSLFVPLSHIWMLFSKRKLVFLFFLSLKFLFAFVFVFVFIFSLSSSYSLSIFSILSRLYFHSVLFVFYGCLMNLSYTLFSLPQEDGKSTLTKCMTAITAINRSVKKKKSKGKEDADDDTEGVCCCIGCVILLSNSLSLFPFSFFFFSVFKWEFEFGVGVKVDSLMCMASSLPPCALSLLPHTVPLL